MKRLLFLILIFFSISGANSQTIKKPNKKQLIQQNDEYAAKLDSLQRLYDETFERLRVSDSLLDATLVPAEQEENWIDKINPDDYDEQVTDSLLSIWYLHHQSRHNKEGENYDMDSVRFVSNVHDSVYLRRLADMNSFITLPYNEVVRNYIILYSEKMPVKMSQMLALSKYYFPIIEEVLSKYNMPDELKYMAVIESAFNPVAVSRAGARGMWQFMFTAGRQYGLTMNSFIDERYDPVKSADAAARYMMDAYKIFGDWNLAICSYNCGPGNVNKAIRRSGSREFWDLYDFLPRETRGYVPAFVGAMYAFTYYKEHGIVPEPVRLPAHTDTILVNKMLHFGQIEELVGIPMQTLKDLNPQYLHNIIPGSVNPYILRIPYSYTSAFIDNEDSLYSFKSKDYFSEATLQNIKNASSNDRIIYKVKSGDYLGRIASRHRVTVNQLKTWNNLRSNNLRIGQRLVIYPRGYSAPSKSSQSSSSSESTPSSATKSSSQASAGAGTVSVDKNREYSVYTVKNGDSLYLIAKNFPGVSANDIMSFNGIGSKLKVGQVIKIPKV